MICVEEAISLIRDNITPLDTETVPLGEALGRILGSDAAARASHPSTPVSAMDGYALRASDLSEIPATLDLIGQSPAGSGFEGTVNEGQAVRIFTGAPVPKGADTVVIQENTENLGDKVRILKGTEKGAYVRAEGQDFRKGETGLFKGTLLTPRHIALGAAMNLAELDVTRRPRVGYLTTGNEVLPVGSDLKPGQLANSNGPGLDAFIRAEGGDPVDLGTASDDVPSLTNTLKSAQGLDLILSTGGVSVGDYDLVHGTLEEMSFETIFWKVAMRPGKPTLFGKLNGVPFIGLPGNPVSVMVGAAVLLRPAFAALLGRVEKDAPLLRARLTGDLPANDERMDYLRARLDYGEDGVCRAAPFPKQDSAMLSILSKADGLIIRAPHAPAAKSGDEVSVLPFGEFF